MERQNLEKVDEFMSTGVQLVGSRNWGLLIRGGSIIAAGPLGFSYRSCRMRACRWVG